MKTIYVDKALDQIQREIDAICKKWGLKEYGFAFSNKDKFFMMGNSSKAFDDRLALMIIDRSLRRNRMIERPKTTSRIVSGDESDAFLQDEANHMPPPERYRPASTGTGNDKIFHDMDELAAMPMTLQRVYGELAELSNMDSIYISPKSVNITLKRRYPAQWESVRNELGFSFIAQTDEAADRWNNYIIMMVDYEMKV